MGSFLFMGLIGLIMGSLINLFFQSCVLDFLFHWYWHIYGVNCLACVKNLKLYIFPPGRGSKMGQKTFLIAGFTLYLNFINVVMFMFKFFGNRRKYMPKNNNNLNQESSFIVVSFFYLRMI